MGTRDVQCCMGVWRRPSVLHVLVEWKIFAHFVWIRVILQVISRKPLPQDFLDGLGQAGFHEFNVCPLALSQNGV